MKRRAYIFAIAPVFILASAAFAQQPAADGQYVSRQEYEALRLELDAVKAKLEAVEQNTIPRQESEEYLQYLDEQLTKAMALAEQQTAGTNRVLVTGYGSVGYTDRQGSPSTFSTSLSPVFLWEVTDRVLFETELELSVSSGGGGGHGHGGGEGEEGAETEVELEYAHLSYLVNDYITVGGGKFLTPFGLFNERLHPSWINKLPDAPLPFGHDGIAPFSSLGAYVRGGVPLNDWKGNYAFYVSNGPGIIAEDEEELGQLDFENYTDIDNNKAVGGRIGILPIPELELGYSFQVSEIDPGHIDEVTAVIQGVDLSYVRDSEELGGVIDIRFEYVFSDVDDTTYHIEHEGEEEEEFFFDNERKAWYVQVAYRPTKHNNEVIQDLEFVYRFDDLDNPSATMHSFDRERHTFGINYWFGPSGVLKFAYQFDDRDGEDAVDSDTFFIQAALGF